MEELYQSSRIAASGMKAQAKRLRVVSQNLANKDSVSTQPGGEPYRRQIVTFKAQLDREIGAETVAVRKVIGDMSEFQRVYDPAHPGADDAGYVLRPNVNPLLEMMDMREAQRSYEANLGVISTSKQMVKQTIDLLR